MSSFKVLIVGGSIAGLTLANSLEMYGIPYELLEAQEIAPQVGVGIGIQPPGLRILDQLGCYDKVLNNSGSMRHLSFFAPGGRKLGKISHFGDAAEKRHGYAIRFLERRALIRILYDNLKDKSHIHTHQRVEKVELSDTSVKVWTIDGTTWEGTVLIGADGVHSSIRGEMWRLSDERRPGWVAATKEKEVKAMRYRYKCLAGFSDPKKLPQLSDSHPGNNFQSFGEDRAWMTLVTDINKVFWMVFIKLPEWTSGRLSETEKDTSAILESCGSDIIKPGLTSADMWKARLSHAVFALEEFVCEKWYFERIMLIGDAVHKINPSNGHGGGCAIESAATIADKIFEIYKSGTKSDTATIEKAWQAVVDFQKPRISQITAQSAQIINTICLQGPLHRWLAFHVVPHDRRMLMKTFSDAVVAGGRLRYLPLRKRHHTIPFEDETEVRLKGRGASHFFVIGVFLAIAMASLTMTYKASSLVYRPRVLQSAAARFIGSWISRLLMAETEAVFNIFWTVESYVEELRLSPLAFAPAWSIAVHLAGLHVIAPLYFAAYFASSGSRNFYFPQDLKPPKRAINAILPSLLVSYGPPVLACLAFPNTVETVLWTFDVANVLFPVVFHVVMVLQKEPLDGKKHNDTLRGPRELSIAMSGICDVSLMSSYGFSAMIENLQTPSEAASKVALQSLSLSAAAFCMLSLLDLRRVKMTSINLLGAFVVVLFVDIAFGPATVVLAFWLWRERLLESIRNVGKT